MMILRDLPLRRVAGLEQGISCFWGSSRCARLLDWERKEEAASGGQPQTLNRRNLNKKPHTLLTCHVSPEAERSAAAGEGSG